MDGVAGEGDSGSRSTSGKASLSHQSIVIKDEDAVESHIRAHQHLHVRYVPEEPVPNIVVETVGFHNAGGGAIDETEKNDDKQTCACLDAGFHF